MIRRKSLTYHRKRHQIKGIQVEPDTHRILKDIHSIEGGDMYRIVRTALEAYAKNKGYMEILKV